MSTFMSTFWTGGGGRWRRMKKVIVTNNSFGKIFVTVKLKIIKKRVLKPLAQMAKLTFIGGRTRKYKYKYKKV
jgi:hypothetical protein